MWCFDSTVFCVLMGCWSVLYAAMNVVNPSTPAHAVTTDQVLEGPQSASPPASAPYAAYCAMCEQSQPFRSKHCTICEQCVDKHNNHVYWTIIPRCVGERNHCLFFGMVLVDSALFVTAWWITGRWLMSVPSALDWFEEHWLRGLALVILLLLITAPGLLACVLTVYHTMLMLTNQTVVGHRPRVSRCA